MRLFEINDEIRSIQDKMEVWAAENDSDVSGFPFLDRLSELSLSRDQKLLAMACLISEYEGEADAIEIQEKKLAARKKAKRNHVERMRDYMALNMEPGEKIEDDRFKISARKTESVEVLAGDHPEEILPKEYLRVKTTIEADKNAIKEALKAGKQVPTCSLKYKTSVVIK